MEDENIFTCSSMRLQYLTHCCLKLIKIFVGDICYQDHNFLEPDKVHLLFFLFRLVRLTRDINNINIMYVSGLTFPTLFYFPVLYIS